MYPTLRLPHNKIIHISILERFIFVFEPATSLTRHPIFSGNNTRIEEMYDRKTHLIVLPYPPFFCSPHALCELQGPPRLR
jgi:hypothetical protein